MVEQFLQQQEQVREGLFQTLRLLHGHGQEQTNANAQIPAIPLDVGIKAIRKCLDSGRRACFTCFCQPTS